MWIADVTKEVYCEFRNEYHHNAVCSWVLTCTVMLCAPFVVSYSAAKRCYCGAKAWVIDAHETYSFWHKD